MNKRDIDQQIGELQNYLDLCNRQRIANQEFDAEHAARVERMLQDVRGNVMALRCLDQDKNDAPQRVIDEYELILEDHFDQGSLDCNTWETSFIWGPSVNINNEEQWYVDTCKNGVYNPLPPGFGNPSAPSPFTFDGSDLIITAQPNPFQPDTLQFTNTTREPDYLSGVITSRASATFTEGYAEVCVKVPCDAQGSWPAAWLFQAQYLSGPDPYDPEIDFLEMPNGNGLDTTCVQQNYHYFSGTPGTADETRWDLGPGGYTSTNIQSGITTPGAGQFRDCLNGNQFAFSMPAYCLPNGEDFCDGYHTFGVDYCDNGITYYVDGIPTHCLTDLPTPQQEVYLIINLAIGGNYPGPSDPNDYPAEFRIDYARMYRKS